MRALPNMTVTAVCDAKEMVRLMNCTLDWPHPIYIRLAKGGDPVVSREENGFAIGKAIPMVRARSRRSVVFMATGVMTTNCLAAADLLSKDGHDASVVHFHTVKPLDEETVLEFADGAVTDLLVEKLGVAIPPVLRIGLPDAFPHKYGLQEELFEVYGLTPAQIAAGTVKSLKVKDKVA
jgi:transketolase